MHKKICCLFFDLCKQTDRQTYSSQYFVPFPAGGGEITNGNKPHTDYDDVGGTSGASADVSGAARVDTRVGLLTVSQNEATDSGVNVVRRMVTLRHLQLHLLLEPLHLRLRVAPYHRPERNVILVDYNRS